MTNVGPTCPCPIVPAPPGGLRHRAAALLELAARWPFDLAEVEVHGLADVLGVTETFPAPSLQAWAFAHLDAPLDSLLLTTLWRRFPSPDALPPRSPIALSRRPDTWADVLAVRGVLNGLIAEVVVDDQATPAESPDERAARRADNAVSIARLRLKAVQEGRPVVIFPEGALSDDGLIRVNRSGFLNAVPPRAQFIVAGLAYESFGCEHAEAVVCSQNLRLPTSRAACAAAVQLALLRATPITLTALLGYYLLAFKDTPGDSLDLLHLEAWVEKCLARLSIVENLCVHRPLRHPEALARRLQRAVVQMNQQHYIDPNGRPTARLGAAVELSSADHQPQRNRLGPAPHRRDPLGFWGNRLRQQAACWPALGLALAWESAVVPPPTDAAADLRVSDCPIM